MTRKGSPRAAERVGMALALVSAVLILGFGVHPVVLLPVTFGGLTVFAHLQSRARTYRR